MRRDIHLRESHKISFAKFVAHAAAAKCKKRLCVPKTKSERIDDEVHPR
jgi:hypothetical protein